MSKLTWLHLSDLHYREGDQANTEVVADALVEDVARCCQQKELRPDLIFFTGDAAYSGQAAQYGWVSDFFARLLERVGLTPQDLYLVPGNHDVDRRRIGMMAQLTGEGLTTREKVRQLLANEVERAMMMERLTDYGTFAAAYAAGGGSNAPGYAYTDRRTVATMELAILGLNSAWLSASDADKEALVLGEFVVRDLIKAAGQAPLKIALMHHPFEWLRPFDREPNEALLWEACDFVLHGHMHSTAWGQLAGPDIGQAMMIAGGACYAGRKFVNAYNLVELDFAQGHGTVYFRTYSDRGAGFWHAGSGLYRNLDDGRYRFELPAHLRQDSPPPAPTTGLRPPSTSQPTVAGHEVEAPTAVALQEPLYQILMPYFSLGELRTLCFSMGIDYELFPHTKSEFVRDLLIYLTRENRLEELVERGRVLRSHAPWPPL